MPYIKPTSQNELNYEILIRKRGENEYASYCPQLNKMIKGSVHETVRIEMKEYIENYIQELSQTPSEPENAVV
jgi:hypothetical protein